MGDGDRRQTEREKKIDKSGERDTQQGRQKLPLKEPREGEADLES